MSERSTISELSNRLVELQQPIRVLDAVAWTSEVEADFFAHDAGRQPAVDAAYYRAHRPLRFEPDDLRAEFVGLAKQVTQRLGTSPVGGLLLNRVREYLRVLDLLDARGTTEFSQVAVELYGGADDLVHPDGPSLASLGGVMSEALANIDSGVWEPPESLIYSADQALEILRSRFEGLWGDQQVQVTIDDGIVADAAAGGDYIKLRADAMFSERDLRILEVHEGWVHVATTLNGRGQPWCSFLSKGTPSTTSTQEGLAVFTEITTMSSTPERLRKVTRRIQAIAMAQSGATFLDVYRWFLDEGLDTSAAWTLTVRVFRGSSPTNGPFTKDLVYGRGFLEVYDFMRLAVKRGRLERLPLLFVGKVALHEMGAVAHLHEDGTITAPEFLPPHLRDLSALASWMAYSNLLNRIDLNAMEVHLDEALR